MYIHEIITIRYCIVLHTMVPYLLDVVSDDVANFLRKKV